ncbi:MAG: glucose-6-phosphate isomerase, partial [Desulfobacteraceae bacterium]|nr:glucose-6-phosphate isomerase [Desulfobacteraceae bacterium]
MLNRISPNQTKAWQKLAKHFQQIQDVHMKDLFSKDQNRFEKFSVRFNSILIDYSKNRINEQT